MARFNPGTLTAAVFAILLGLGGAVTVRQYLAQQTAQVALPAPTPRAAKIFVPVAAVDLQAGHAVSMNDIAIFQFTPEDFAKSRFKSTAFLSDSRQISSRTLKTPVRQGEAFLPVAFYADGMGPGLAQQLRPGFRAVTVPIENVGAVAGFARPGSFVDVLFRSNPAEDRPEITLTLIEMVEVLAVNESLHPDSKVVVSGQNASGTVTVAVTPPQAKALKVVESRGQLSLALRNPDDLGNILPVSSSTAQRLMIEDILGLQPANRKERMEVYKGGKLEVVEFEGYRRPLNDDRLVPGLISTPIASELEPQHQQTGVRPVSTGREIDFDSRAGGS